jgi:hypothetical protein
MHGAVTFCASTPLIVLCPGKPADTMWPWNGVTGGGRPCLGYERIENWILDPDTRRSERFAIDESQFITAVEAEVEHGEE